MNNQSKTHSNDEILLKEYLRSLWDKKIYIFFFIFLSVVCGSIYLHNVERQYLVEYKLKPVGEN